MTAKKSNRRFIDFPKIPENSDKVFTGYDGISCYVIREIPEFRSFINDLIKQDGYYILGAWGSNETERAVPAYKLYVLFSHESADNFVLTEFFHKGADASEINKLYDSFKDISKRFPVFIPYLYEFERYFASELPQHNRNKHDNEYGLTVGPIHAGIIEAGVFLFKTDGERILKVKIRSGCKYRGMERAFENLPIAKGISVAGRVSGDSSCAHAIAWSMAVEQLLGIDVSDEAMNLRAILAEIERIYAHINDTAFLLKDCAWDRPASFLFEYRNALMNVVKDVMGSRFPWRIIHPGGVTLYPDYENLKKLADEISNTVEKCRKIFTKTWFHNRLRTRTKGLAVVRKGRAQWFGADGIIARSCNLITRDFRYIHPFGPYTQFRENFFPDFPPCKEYCIARKIEGLEQQDVRYYNGGTLSRFSIRCNEVIHSDQIIQTIIDEQIKGHKKPERRMISDDQIREQAITVPPYHWSVGAIEGWRGPVVYWLMKGEEDHIFRVKIRDPSISNWHIMAAALDEEKSHEDREDTDFKDIILADFPVINKSFNLSYAGNDL